MRLHRLMILTVLVWGGFAGRGYGEPLETLRQQFEIYHRLPGEMEILSTDNVEKIDQVLKRTESKRLTARKALDEEPIAEPSTVKQKKALPSPLFAEGDVAPFLHYVAVERAFSKRSLQRGKPEEVISSIQYVYLLADRLSESGSLERRTAAALIRLQMLEIVQALLLDPHCRRAHHHSLHVLFDEQVHRMGDPTIWVHYREEGKRFFEETTRSGLEKTVAPNLLNELSDRRALEDYKKRPAKRLSHDQSVFLQVMSVVIESSEMPFYRRQPVLLHLNKELKERQGTANEPVFALLLLREVSESMRLFAQERAGIEMAYLALSASLHGQPRRKIMNVLVGKEYEFSLIPGGNLCTYEGNVKPFYVPYR